ncbi:hypothetical protein LTR86_004525 [Recurvomyces mirabilis]|nr:hypothetical protein LTR86_004525 [Recurvomyces mirabilis]
MNVRFLLTTTDLGSVSVSPVEGVSELQEAPSGTIWSRPNVDDANVYKQRVDRTQATPNGSRIQYSNVWEPPATSDRRHVLPDFETPPISNGDRPKGEYTYHTDTPPQETATDDSSHASSFGSGRPVSPDSTSDTNSYSDRPTDNKPRPPRPAYNEEQRFFIMFSRIVLYQSWPEIEHGFGELFGRNAVPRSRGGLTSVYYRVRKRWGLEEVLKTDNEATYGDRFEVGRRAQWMSPAFLDRIGYPGTYQVSRSRLAEYRR